MNKRTNKFSILCYFALSVLLGLVTLNWTPDREILIRSQSPLEIQIESYLEREAFHLVTGLRADFITYLVATARDYEFDPLLILAIMKVESSFNPNAISNRGAHGLLQLKLVAAQEVANVFDTKPMASRQLLDPFINVKIGIQYLSCLRDQVGGGWTRILAAYNAGPTYIKRSGHVPTGYASKVLKTYREFLKRFPST